MIKFFFFFFLSLISITPAYAAPDVSEFAESTQWLKLLHYQKQFGGYKGLIIDDDFYLNPDGRENPQAELETEIKNFQKGKEKCRFPARFNLLKDKGYISGDLSECKEYQQFMQDVRPAGITLLFTDSYMSNPASMFGHTLVRIDTARKGTQMLAHGSNFGVLSGVDTGAVLAIKGLIGGYNGSYSLSPYWTVINTYNNIENRDIWEYKLNLTEDEQIKFVNHLYEMKDAKIQYFFLTKNCSYMILELLEAVRPSLDLSSHYNYYAIPLDTLKTVKNVPEFVSDIHYRPSRYTKIKTMIDNMSQKQYQLFLAAVKQHDYDMSDLSAEEKSVVLEAVYQYYQYQYIAQKMEIKEYRKNSFAVLRMRSQLPPAEELQIDGQEPSLSHDSAQISLSSGIFGHKSFEEVMVRPAYTTITDDSWGLVQGAGIKVLESRWRYYNQKHKFVLQSFTPFHIDSFVPSTRVFSPISYITNIDMRREYNPRNRKEGYVADVHFAVGKTYALFYDICGYALIGPVVQYGGFIKKNYLFGVTPELGLFADWNKVRVHTFITKTLATDKFGDKIQYKAISAYGLTRNLTLEAEYSKVHYRGGYHTEEYMLTLRQAF